MFELFKMGIPRAKSFWLGLFVSVLQGISAVALLGTSTWLISRAAEQPPVMYLMVAVVGVRGFALGRAAFRYAERILLHDSAFRMLADIRPRLFKKLIPFSPAGFTPISRGDTLSRLGTDVDELQNLPLRVISPLVQSIAVSLLTVIGLGLILPSAAVALLLALLAAFLVALPLSGLISRQADLHRAQATAVLSGHSIDLLENLDVLRAYGWLPGSLKQLSDADSELLKLSRRQSFSLGLGQALFSITASLATVTTAYLGINAVASAQQPGVLLALIALIPMAVFDVSMVAQPTLNAWNNFRASANRIAQLQSREVPEILKPVFGNQEVEGFQSLKFTDVSLAYPNHPVVVRNVNLEINPGETLLVQGASGTGKTTIALALLRFLDLAAGKYELNGLAIENVSETSVRSLIGLVEQRPTIFQGSVKANLLIAKESATDEELWAVLEQVGLKQTFLLRKGLDTDLGERGVLISGGEAQRLALARALLAEFSVLILDEPTANVDQENAVKLVEDLLSAAKQNSDRSIILITHDSSLKRFADVSLSI